MATVFLAQDLKHKRPVALKVLHPELAHALGSERFHREVELAARLQHSHILTVLDSGEADGNLWFTMPFVDGETLRSRLTREKQLPVEEAVRIAGEAGRALDYAHRHGVIHRDIKPENILLTLEGETLVADFGIARALSGTDERLTETGLAIGTPAYMSPEQAAGTRDLDARTDIYALGAVLYEMLAGEPPFTGATPQAVIAKRFREEAPPVRRARPAVPEAVELAVTRALASLPADRFATAAEFVKAIGGGQAATPASGTAVTPAVGTRSVAASARRRVPAGFALLLLGFLIGLGVLFAWRRGSHSDPATKVIAVLPFENQGDSAQEYFADGITDEVRGKLAALPGLTVLAGGSSRTYKHSDKPLADVARELGANYLLVAKVRWARAADGSLQVRVSPELVSVTGGTAATRWQQGFDAALTDVFKVQADIASRVAGALDVALTDSVSRRLAARPTGNLPAYDAFLRGEEHFVTRADNSPVGLRRAIGYYKQALALDSTFVPAWAQLAQAQALLYFNSVPVPALGEASRVAAEQAVRLDPNSAPARLALARYYELVPRDWTRVRSELQLALRQEPGNALALRRLSELEWSASAWDSALVHARAAVRLDPRDLVTTRILGAILRQVGRYPEAREVLSNAQRVAPTSSGLLAQVMVELAAGDLDSARAVLRRGSSGLDQPGLVAYFGNYYDLFWILDDAQQRLLLTLTPAEFDNDLGTYGIVMSETAALRGDRTRVRSAADTAVMGFRSRAALAPDDAQTQVLGGLAYAYQGQKAEAIRLGERGVTKSLSRRDEQETPYLQQVLARIYILCGEPDKAIGIIETLVQHPGDYTPGWFRIDPNYAPLRGNPRFDQLVQRQ